MTAFAVIGANWGDEGKGLATDALASRLISDGHQVVVVRSNGGAQAGHGVTLRNGDWHVFHHVGAGTLAGAATHLSQFFVAHPMLLGRELDQLGDLGHKPSRLTIDPRAPVTTPWDMAINQMVETIRGPTRHGSTGMGFGETIERTERGPALFAEDLRDRSRFLAILRIIRDEWAPQRFREIGLPEDGGQFSRLFARGELASAYLDDVDRFNAEVSLMADAEIISGGVVVFEGAQGLRLDMDAGEMPHVTRSNTGLRNMLHIAREAGIDELRPIYMTRAYATRHGAGPLPLEGRNTDGASLGLEWANVVDRTNAPNDWQGAIRQAPLDIDALRDAINTDLAHAETAGIRVTPTLGVTCLDQIPARGRLHMGGRVVVPEPKYLPFTIAQHLKIDLTLCSWGPCREDVIWTRGAERILSIPADTPRPG